MYDLPKVSGNYNCDLPKGRKVTGAENSNLFKVRKMT